MTGVQTCALPIYWLLTHVIGGYHVRAGDVRALQRDKGLAVDGQVGPATFAALTEGGIGD